MKKRMITKLTLAKETVRVLEGQDLHKLEDVVGGTGAACATGYRCTQSCYCTTANSHCTA